MTHITPEQLDRIQELIENNPRCRLVTEVTGLVTCDGMAIECEGGLVIHPLSFLQLIDGPEYEVIEVLK